MKRERSARPYDHHQLLKHGLLAGMLALACTHTNAQLHVQAQNDLELLARTITGPGVQILAPQITCHAEGFGEFTYSGSVLGLEEGIVLSSGRLQEAVGPNNVGNISFSANTPGSPILNTVTGRTTYDACRFEFDIIPSGDSLLFDFVLGSEEYNEWVGSQFNDVFGFFIRGPGITGDAGIGDYHNIALVPGTSQPVTINNVNNGSNAAHYFDNTGGQHIQFDGLTRGLTAVARVQPCETYHLQLVVADASDRLFDSGVFIAKMKSNPITMQLITDNGASALVEGCNNGSVRFSRPSASPWPLTLQYYLTGTATNGADYQAILPTSNALPKSITIPAGQTFVDRPIITVADGLDEGSEYLRFLLGNPHCPAAAPLDTLDVLLLDTLIADVLPMAPVICRGDSVQFHVTGGQQYQWSPATGLSSTTSASPWARPTTTTTYTVVVREGDCTRTLRRTVRVSQLALSAVVTDPLCNGGANGAINLSVSGGLVPYSYMWSGPGVNGTTSQDLTGLVAGTYTVTVTDAACTRTQSFNVGQPANLAVGLVPSTLVFGQNIACHGGANGTITTNITGGTAPYQIQWTGPSGFTAQTANIAGLSVGSYAVTVIDAHGCSRSGSVELVASAPLVATISGVSNVLCFNDPTGAATVNVTGGVPPYTYSWNSTPAQSGATASGLRPGSYQVQVSDSYGCPVSATTTITGPTQALGITLSSIQHVRCRGAATGAASISASGGTAPYTYTWSGPGTANTASISGVVAGAWQVTVTDHNGCSAILPVNINQPAQALSGSVVSVTDVRCHGAITGGATVQGSGGTGPYAYSWNTVPVRYGATLSGVAAGSYQVTITDVEQCSVVVPVNIAQPANALNATIANVQDARCHGAADGSATVGVSGGTAPYTYQWNTTPAQTTATATGLLTGEWTVVVTDANGCSRSVKVQVGQPGALTITGTVVPAMCMGGANGSVDASVTGGTAPYTYAWTGAGGFSSSAQDISGLPSGGYTLTVQDARGCTANRTFQVSQPGLFTLSAVLSAYNGYGVSCPTASNGAIDLSLSGGAPPYSYAWTGPSGPLGSTQDLSGLPAGTYSVVVSDANGCGTGASYTLQAPPALSLSITPVLHNGFAVSCAGGADGAANATASGGVAPYTFTWSGPSFAASTAAISGRSAGTYTVIVTDVNGCTQQASIQLSAPPALAVAVSDVGSVHCFGSADGQATVLASGGVAPYGWSWTTVPAQYSATAITLAAGSYTASAVDANGCTASLPVNVPGPAAALSVAVVSVVHVACHDASTGAATVQAAGGTAPYTYTWNSMPQQTGATATGLAAGTRTVTVVDANGCSVSRNVVVQQPQAPLAAALLSSSGVTCHGANNGAITIAVTGGSGSANVQWNTVPPRTGTSLTGLPSGTWTATVTDANGCTNAVQLVVVVPGPSAPLAVSTAVQPYIGGAGVSCPGAKDASVQTTVTGGTAPFTYLWSHPDGTTSSTKDPSGLGAGTHQLLVTDANGCQAQRTVVITSPTALGMSAVVVSALCHGGNTGSIDITVSGGASPYAYAWSGPGSFTSNATDLQQLFAGVYTLQLTDANGCKSLQVVDVTEPGTFQITTTVSVHGPANISCAGGADGSITAQVQGGTQPYAYQWMSIGGPQGNGAAISGLTAGTYHLVLSDQNGCQAAHTEVLTEPASLSLHLSASSFAGGVQVGCAGSASGSITAAVSGGVPNYTYAWQGPNGFQATSKDIASLSAGTYTLQVTDQNGCQISSSITLQGPPAIQASATVAAFAGGHGVSCAGASDGAVQLQLSGGVAPLTITWSGPGGFSSNAQQIQGLVAGTYTANIADANGCTRTVTATVSAPPALVVNATVALFNGHAIACQGGSTGAIDLQVTGGTGPLTYLWYGPNAFTANTEDVSALSAGAYTAFVMDANGCKADLARTLSQPAALVNTASITAAACQGANTGAVDLTTVGGIAPYTWQWSAPPVFSANTQDITSLYASVYQVVVTDANGCTRTNTYDVGQPDLFQVSTQVGQYTGGFHVSCAGSTNGWIDAQVTGGTAPHAFHWTGPNGYFANTASIAGLAAGAYQLTIVDGNGCSTVRSLTLIAPPALAIGLTPSVFAGGANTGCDGSADGSIDAVVSGGVPAYSFAWSGPQGAFAITEDVAGLGAGSYTLQVTDALGCERSATVALSAPGGLSIAASAHMRPNGFEISCHDALDGSIALSIQGGAAPLQVQWTGPNGPVQGSTQLNGLGAGLYQVVVTDANGCSVTAQVGLKAPPALTAQVTTSLYSGGYQVSCANATDGSINLAVNGGTAPYAVQWSGPAGFTAQASVLHGLSAGNYQVSVTDASGCTVGLNVPLSAPSPLQATAVLSDAGHGFQVGCSGTDGAIALSVSGGSPAYQFAWSGPAGYASQLEDPQGLVAGGYQVTITDGNGCALVRSYSLTGAVPFSLSGAVTSNECSGTVDGEVDLTIAGGVAPFTIQWTGPSGFASQSEDLTGLASGIYEVKVQDAMGCVAGYTAEIIAAAPIHWDLYMSTYGDVNIPCHGAATGVLSITATGGFQPLVYAWSGPNGYASSAAMLTGLSAGSYALSVIDDHGCRRDTVLTLVEPEDALTADHVLATYASGTNVPCHGGQDGSIDVTVTGGTAPYTFDWRNGATGFSTAEDVFDLFAGTYQLMITDARACQVMLDVVLTEPASPLAVQHDVLSYNGADISCAGSTDGGIIVALDGGSPAYTMDWTGPDAFASVEDTLVGLSAGAYVLHVVDINGCELFHTVTLVSPDSLLIDPQVQAWPSGSGISCHGANDGAIVLAITGGTGIPSISWNGPAGPLTGGASLDALTPGDHCATVVDANGCTAEACTVITEPAEMSATHQVEDALCGSSDGQVDVTLIGGQAPLTFVWDNGANTMDLANVPFGPYQLSITDVNGCSITVEAVVGGSPAVAGVEVATAPLCHGDLNGAIGLDVQQGTAPFTVLWSDGVTDEDREGLAGGNYAFVVTDAMGCTWGSTVILLAPHPLSADTLVPLYANGHAVSTYDGQDGSILLQPTGGTAPYQVLWDHGAEGAPLTGLPAGHYTATVTDANGCALTMQFVLDGPKEVLVPTGFTPNGDGQNDVFVVRGLEGFPENQFVVYNRWGNIVYERLNYANDWHGENGQGEDLASGTYFVILKLKRTDTVIQQYVDLRR